MQYLSDEQICIKEAPKNAKIGVSKLFAYRKKKTNLTRTVKHGCDCIIQLGGITSIYWQILQITSILLVFSDSIFLGGGKDGGGEGYR